MKPKKAEDEHDDDNEADEIDDAVHLLLPNFVYCVVAGSAGTYQADHQHLVLSG
jgi:hypothetical protein